MASEPPGDLFDAFSDEDKRAIADHIRPGLRELVERLRVEFQAIVSRATQDFDPVAVSALRVGHAILVAARRNDEETLRKWETPTVKYMEAHAIDEYLQMPLPPRPSRGRNDRHDRHLIVISLRARIEQYLRQFDRKPYMSPAGLLESTANELAITMRLQTMVSCAFPHLKAGERADTDRLSRRVKQHHADGQPWATLDPEVVILDALEDLDVPRTDAQNWLRPLR